MPGVELGLAIFAAIDLCMKYGNRLTEICAACRCAETEVAERALQLEYHWMKTCMQLDFLRRVWQSLDEQHQSIHEEILQVLISKLQLANSKLESCIGKQAAALALAQVTHQELTHMQKLQYSLYKKERLDSAIEDLKKWQEIFDPSWFLIMKAARPQIDAELARDNRNQPWGSVASAQSLRDSLKENSQEEIHVFLPENGLESAQIFDIYLSSAKVAQRVGSDKWLILDSVACPPGANIPLLKRDVRDLGRKLRHTDPMTFGLLSCYGVVQSTSPAHRQPTSFTFVFRVPEGISEPQSLRSRLLAGDVNHSLSERFKLGKELAKSVSYIHAFGFVHKNICPETILLFKDRESSLGQSFLVGFENFRIAEGRTLRFGDSSWEKNLYRHPRRQGLKPEDDYSMQHDIYSLGVCLLELGLWESFVLYDEDGVNPQPSPTLGLSLESSEFREPVLIKAGLVFLARSELPKRMGSRYAKVVETCLTCLDENNTDFGDEREFQDADGIQVGVRYIEKVVSHS